MSINLKVSSLTDYEKRIICLICEAKQDHDISSSMEMSLDEIRFCKEVIFQKTQTANWAELVIYAIRHEIFTLHF